MDMQTVEFKMDSDGGKPAVPMAMGRIESLVRLVLKKRFSGDAERQSILGKGVRMNICCPWCGDSSDPRKKRGNLYVNGLYYKCYNDGCSKYSDFEWFLKDFDCYNELTEDEKTELKVTIRDNSKNFKVGQLRNYELNVDSMITTDFSKALVPRAELMKACKLWNITPDGIIGTYLTKRLQPIDNRFAWDNYKKRLFIFNLDRSGEWVFGMQTRQFGEAEKSGAKYKTYKLEDVWTKFIKRDDPEFISSLSNINHLSTVFGVLQMDFNRTITIFEGPLDHFVYGGNSAATCSINNEWPFDLENKRWFQDNDNAGRKVALEYLSKGDSVFMWSKFLKDNSIPGNKKIKDLNDLRVYEWANNVKFDFDDYFTTHKLDGVDI